MSMKYIDEQIFKHHKYLISKVKLNFAESMKVASIVEEEIRTEKTIHSQYKKITPIPVEVSVLSSGVNCVLCFQFN